MTGVEPDALSSLDWDHRPACEMAHGRRTVTGRAQPVSDCGEPAYHYTRLACPRSHQDRWLYICDDHYSRLVLDAPDIVCSCGAPIRAVDTRHL